MTDEFVDDVCRYADRFCEIANSKTGVGWHTTNVLFVIGLEDDDPKRLLDAVSDTLKRRGWKIDVYVELPAGRAGWIQMRKAGVQA